MALLWSPKQMPVWTLFCQQVFGLALRSLGWKNICQFQKDLTSFAADAGAIWHVPGTVAQQRELSRPQILFAWGSQHWELSWVLGSRSCRPMSKVSKRKWPAQASKTLLVDTEKEVTGPDSTPNAGIDGQTSELSVASQLSSKAILIHYQTWQSLHAVVFCCHLMPY